MSTLSGLLNRLKSFRCSVSVHVVRQNLANLAEIPPDDQILLFGPPFARLDPRKPLYAYALPSVWSHFVRLHPNSYE